MIHDWQVFDDCHQSCKRCGLRLWRARSGGSWNAVTGDGVPASFGLLPDGSRIECVRPPNLLPAIVVIDYTGDPDRHSGCERFMHRVRDQAESSSLAVPAAAPTACGYPAVFWELGPARLHLGWTWCLDCFPDRAGDGARQREALPLHAARHVAQQHAAALKTERKAKQLHKARKAVAKGPGGAALLLLSQVRRRLAVSTRDDSGAPPHPPAAPRVESAVIAKPRIFVLKKVPPRPYQADELCECCGMGATAARVQFEWPPDAHFRACWLCAELLTAQALIGVALRLACHGKGN